MTRSLAVYHSTKMPLRFLQHFTASLQASALHPIATLAFVDQTIRT
jgi:hypothetical protein